MIKKGSENVDYIAITDANNVDYPIKVWFANSNNTLKLVYERPIYDIHIINLAINTKLGNADKVSEIKFTNNLNLRSLAYNDNVVDVTYQNNPTYEFLVQNNDNDTFTCYIANAFWGENSKVYCYGSFVTCFDGCVLLKNIPIEIFDISYVTDISYIFRNCKAVQLLDLRDWDFINVRDSYNAFLNCESVTEILGNFKNYSPTSGVAFSGFLRGCKSLKKIDLSGINTRNVTTFSALFLNCLELTRIDISNFNTSSCAYLNSMFWGCRKLKYLYLPDFVNTLKISLYDMFRWCYSLESIYISNLNTSNTVRMSSMFVGCYNIQRIFSQNFDLSSLIDFDLDGQQVNGGYEMFINCDKLKGGNGTIYSNSHANSAEYARIDGENGLPGYFTDPADAIKITLINVDNEGYSDEIYLCAGDTYTLETLQGYTAIVTDNNGNTYQDGYTITITENITLNFVWTATS